MGGPGSADVRVLVVDDQSLFRRAMVAVVEETDGFTVVGAAASGEESLAVAQELLPDLVLMDVNLPGIDGVAASRLLTGADDAPVVILLSTYEGDEFDLHGSGAASYLAKGAFGSDRLIQAWTAATSST